MGCTLEFATRYGPALLNGLGNTLYVSVLGSAMGIAIGFLIALIRWPADRSLFNGSVAPDRDPSRHTDPRFSSSSSTMPVRVMGSRSMRSRSESLGWELWQRLLCRDLPLRFPLGSEGASRGGAHPGKLSSAQILWRIKVPQMLVVIIPPAINQLIILVKESAVLSIITVPELTKVTERIVNETFTIAAPYLAMAFIYWGVIETLSRLGTRLERKGTRHPVSRDVSTGIPDSPERPRHTSRACPQDVRQHDRSTARRQSRRVALRSRLRDRSFGVRQEHSPSVHCISRGLQCRRHLHRRDPARVSGRGRQENPRERARN